MKSIVPASRPSDAVMRVLLIEDNPLDAELCLLALRRSGTTVESVVAENELQVRAALLAFVPDIVLCDFSFPNFDGFAAQRLVRASYPSCPLIFVSGAISEERAAMALQSGAVDYVMKSSLVRLPIAVERAVGAAKTAAQSEVRAQWHVQRLERLWRIANDPAMRGPELSHAMLAAAAIDLNRSQIFSGYLCRTDAADCVTDQSSPRPLPERSARESAAHRALGEPGFRGSLRTRSWVDVAGAPEAPFAVAASGWHGLISTHFEADGTVYWLTFASTEAAVDAFNDDDFAYVQVLATSFANQVQVNALEASLRDEEERSRQHARRLEALWRIGNDPNLTDDDKWLAMLSQAATSIWPGQGYRAMLWRIVGERLTLEAVGEAPDCRLTTESMDVGTNVPLSSSIVGLVLDHGGGTRSWDDARKFVATREFDRAQGVRSCIVTTFGAGAGTWALTFASGRVASRRLGTLENAYIEVLASFFANHVQQRWQFEQIRYQQSHDGLTGLLSRSEFHARTVAATAAATGRTCAMLIVDVSAFHEINASYGNAVGDAVLIEIARALNLRHAGGAGRSRRRRRLCDLRAEAALARSSARTRERLFERLRAAFLGRRPRRP